MVTTSKQQLTRSEQRVLYQVLHHTQQVSRYGFGDIFWVSGPSLDELFLQLGDPPHRLISTLNRLASKELISFETGNGEIGNVVCPTSYGWRLHPQFSQMIPWIIQGEGSQDWEDAEEFASLDEAERERLATLPTPREPKPLPSVQAIRSVNTYRLNRRLRSNYFMWPTAEMLEEIARQVHPNSRTVCIVPSHGCVRFLTAARFRRQMAGHPDERINVALHHEYPVQRLVESVYVADSRLFLVTSSWSVSPNAH